MLFSPGKDTTEMAHVAIRTFDPSKPPFPQIHVDSSWEFPSLIAFLNAFAWEHGLQLFAYGDEEGRAAGISRKCI
jgi:sulfate adenylyltransferase subunit 2